MSGGLAALLDDIAALARMAASSVDDVAAAAGRASAKAAGVVIDDTAVTPQYLTGISPKRELPIIKRIAVGSLRNKLVFILPALLLLSQFASWSLTPLLMLGGCYLCYEGAHKVWDKLSGHHPEHGTPVVGRGPDAEEQVIKGAITTDFILSCEIMVIALNEVASAAFISRTITLVIVALGITVLVYGIVALIVKMDDVGLHLAAKNNPASQRTGNLLVKAMPKVLTAISVIGTLAMLWVGGHIILVGMNDLGFHPVYAFVHGLEEAVHHLPAGGVLGWLINTAFSLVLGLIVGFVVVGLLALLPFKTGHDKTTEIQDEALVASGGASEGHGPGVTTD